MLEYGVMRGINRLLSIRENNLAARILSRCRGKHFGARYEDHLEALPADAPNPLRDFFASHRSGRGIWKWEHYFEIYHRHFAPFRNKAVNVLEIGVFSGGSLEMWRNYFGPQATIHGIDIEPDCKLYEAPGINIYSGDQGDRSFWRDFCSKVPEIDIVIDDGSHRPPHQIATLEELLPHLNSGGIYLCEDVHGQKNGFASYVQGLASALNEFDFSADMNNPERRIVCKSNRIQNSVKAISFYPFVTVIEKNTAPVLELVAPKHGTQWQPFIS